METKNSNWKQEFDQNEEEEEEEKEEEEEEEYSQEQNTLADLDFEYEDEEEEGFEPPALETLYTFSQKHEQGPHAHQEQTQQPLSEEQEAILYLEHIKELLQARNIDFDAWLQEMKSRDSENWWWPDAEDDQDPPSTTEPSEESSKIDYTPTPKPPPKKLMGMKSFRYLESRVLANFIKDSEDERMNKIKARLGFMKKVKAPTPSVNVIHKRASDLSLSREDVSIAKEDGSYWALKKAVSFLQKEGCQSPKQSLTKFVASNMSPHLQVFLKQGGRSDKRRDAVGDSIQEPDINPALKRLAERSIWRYIIQNSMPKYPLPRFILPRHRFLRKIEAQLIGPGSYELDYLEKQRLKKLKFPSLWDSCSKRFPKEKNMDATPPIRDPYGKWDEACERSRHPGSVSLFQSTPCNFRYKNFYLGCGLSPGHYNIKSPMDEFIKAKKSNRGMYDSGSGQDAFCTIENDKDKLANRLGPGSYNIRKNLKETNTYDVLKGKFSRTERSKMFGFRAAFDKPLWPRDNGGPGPTTYDPNESSEWTENSWIPFNVAVKGREFGVNTQNKLMAPDYYFYRDLANQTQRDAIGSGWKSNFKSQTPLQSNYIKLKERNRAANSKWDQEKEDKKQSTCD